MLTSRIFRHCGKVGDDAGKVSVPSSEVSFKDTIKAIKQLVDKQVSGTESSPLSVNMPPLDVAQHQELLGISSPRFAALEARYLKR